MNSSSRVVAMVAGGNVTRSSLGRLPLLTEHLGPVKASSFRLASRIANSLRAGSPVQEFEALAPFPVILVCVPDRAVVATVRELEQSPLDWRGRVLVLCDTPRDSSVGAGLTARGARVATFNIVAGLVVMEGHRVAVREFRRALLPRSARVVQLEGGGKPLLLAGLTFAGFTAHLAAAASDCLRGAGIEPAQARAMVQNLMEESLRAHTKAGRRVVDSNWNEPEWNSIRQQHAALRKAQPDLADYFASAIEASAQLAGGAPTRALAAKAAS